MPDIVLTAARFGFVLLLWIFVFTVLSVIKRDISGVRQSRLVAAPRGFGAGVAQPAAKARKQKVARTLTVTEGSLAGTRIPLSDHPITIGRAQDSTLVLNDDYASSKHARLVPKSGQWIVEDLGSTNGTYLNQAKVTGPTPVPLETPIRIGRTVLELRS